ncbi:head-tail connector protein [Sphingobacterium spiritivorum]|uniref:head-tail connector protein n=1 Tax=Sphingobacterium spiritivorum TaxID=258 RepID=UPI003DA342D5
MVTLEEVKEALNIDYPDVDGFLSILLGGAIQRAERITGRNYTDTSKDNYEVMEDDIKKAVIQDVATNYSVRDDIGAEGAENTSNNASIYTYRQNSTNPMF